jgi:KipI family sensor histidine kinase inhibitor
VALAQKLRDLEVAGVVEMVPTFRSLMVHYDPVRLPQAELKARIAPLIDGIAAAEQVGRHWRLPVCYDQSLGPDLADVALRTGLGVADVIERHSGVVHHVYMMGFLPGLPYLGGLPKEFELPRRENPRLKVPRGAVAVAMSMTVIYPLESPGGWHILGVTPVPLWDLGRDPPTVLDAGDKVTFVPVSVSEYEALRAKAVAGGLELVPEAQRDARQPA